MNDMRNLYWIERGANSNCGHRGTFPKELKRTEEYRNTKDYFRGRGGEPGHWTIYYDNIPCDLSATPFVHLVSEKFKIIAETLGINAAFTSVQVQVSDKPINLNYYLPQPLDSIEFLDLTSPRIRISEANDMPPGSPTPYGSIKYSQRYSHVFYDLVGDKQWVTHPNATGSPWIVSEAFKQEIEKHELTNFRFVRALPATNK